MDSILGLVVLVTSVIVLYFAFFKGSDLGKLILFILFSAILLGDFISLLSSIALFDFIQDFFSQLSGFIVIAEIILIVIVTFVKRSSKPVKPLYITIIILLVAKLLMYFI